MRKKMKNVTPAFWAIFVLSTVEIIKFLEIIPEHQQYNFEVMSNIAMLIVAADGFFLWGIPSLLDSSCGLGRIFNNITVSAMAFVMNIDVFERTLRRDYILEDLWGWHTCWVICATMQIVFLTGIGKAILCQIKILLKKISCIGRALENFFIDFLDAMKRNRCLVLFVMFGFIIWSVFLIAQCNNKSTTDILSHINFWKNSVLLWIYYFIAVFLAYTMFHAFPKVKVAIQSASGGNVILISMIFILAILTNVLPPLLQALTMVICIPASVTGSIWLVVKKMNSDSQKAKDVSVKRKDINPRDVLIVMLCFAGIPLTFIFLIAFLGTDSNSIMGKDPASITAWLDFMGTAAEVAYTLLNLPR